MSVNNSIFKGDCLKLKFQMLHINILAWMYYFWSGVRRLARLWVSILLIPVFSSFLFFLSLQVLLFFLSFGKFLICSAKGDTPLDPRFFFLLLSFLCFASLLFTFLFFAFLYVKFQFCFVFSIERTYHRWRWMCTVEIIDREFVGCNCRITERKMFFFAFYPSCPHSNQTCSHEARRVRFSVRSM